MTQDNDQHHEHRRALSDRMAKVASLVDLRVREIEARVLELNPQLPLSPTVVVTPVAGAGVGYMAFDFTYTLNATDARGQHVLESRVAVNLQFTVPADVRVSDDELAAFGCIGVVETAHPYIREIVHCLSVRMGLPPFVLDIVPPIDE